MGLAFFVVGIALQAGCARSTRPTAEANAWQELTLRTLEGEERSVASYRGKVVLLDIWASWCEPCRVSMPFYNALFAQLEPRGFTVVGISVDEDAAAARRMVEREGLKFPVLWDPSAKLPELLGVQIMPTAFVLTREGQVHSRHQGFSSGDDAGIRAAVEKALGNAEAAAP